MGKLADGRQTIGEEGGRYLDHLEPASAALPQVKHEDGMASEEADAQHDGTGIEEKDGNQVDFGT